MLDVVAEVEVDVEGLLHAAVEHAVPLDGGLFEADGAEEVAGLHDDLEGVGEIVGEFADLYGVIFGDGCVKRFGHTVRLRSVGLRRRASVTQKSNRGWVMRRVDARGMGVD